jgi:hypothetical protein
MADRTPPFFSDARTLTTFTQLPKSAILGPPDGLSSNFRHHERREHVVPAAGASGDTASAHGAD